jgi:hypothetical protein
VVLHDLIDGTNYCPPKLITNTIGDAQVMNHAYIAWQRRDMLEYNTGFDIMIFDFRNDFNQNQIKFEYI